MTERQFYPQPPPPPCTVRLAVSPVTHKRDPEQVEYSLHGGESMADALRKCADVVEKLEAKMGDTRFTKFELIGGATGDIGI